MSCTYYAPKTLYELADILEKLTLESKIISGGTDLTIGLRRCPGIDALLFPGKVKGIRDISQIPDGIRIGAMATMSELAESELLTPPYAAIKHATAEVGSVQIRNSATIGGNIANASPAADLAPVLYLLDAQVDVMEPGGNISRVPIDKLITGAGETSLKFNEIIIGVIIPKVKDETAKSAFCKLGYRKCVTVSRIGLAMSTILDRESRIAHADVVVGAITPVPVHVEKAEQYLIGKSLNIVLSKKIGAFLSELIMEITPKEFDRDYKAKAAYGIAEDLISKIMGV